MPITYTPPRALQMLTEICPCPIRRELPEGYRPSRSAHFGRPSNKVTPETISLTLCFQCAMIALHQGGIAPGSRVDVPVDLLRRVRDGEWQDPLAGTADVGGVSG